jgi:hypothetical protein
LIRWQRFRRINWWFFPTRRSFKPLYHSLDLRNLCFIHVFSHSLQSLSQSLYPRILCSSPCYYVRRFLPRLWPRILCSFLRYARCHASRSRRPRSLCKTQILRSSTTILYPPKTVLHLLVPLRVRDNIGIIPRFRSFWAATTLATQATQDE